MIRMFFVHKQTLAALGSGRPKNIMGSRALRDLEAES